MKTLKMTTYLLPLYLLTHSISIYADVERGKVLHDQSCMGCHDTSVYQRTEKQMRNLADLHAQVNRCSKPAGADWNKEDKNDVAEYLNHSFYHYK